MQKAAPSGFVLDVQADLQGVAAGAERPALAAFAFGDDARLLATAPLDEKGRGTLQLAELRSVERLRVLVGPRPESGAPDFAALKRLGAAEIRRRVDPRAGLKDQVAFELSPPVWADWLMRRCHVRGALVKQVRIGGVDVDFPVIGATVEVYEVDRWPLLVARIPDLILDELRDIVAGPVRKIPPPPEPDPIRVIADGLVRLAPRPGPDPAPFARAQLTPQPVPLARRAAEIGAALDAAPGGATLRSLALAGSARQFREALVAEAALLRPILCLYYPGLATKKLIATAVTDECGQFATSFLHRASDPDQPDLYFKAKQRLFGFFDAVIHAPTPVLCHTFWNYACGSAVRLVTQSPWAQTGTPCPPVSGPAGKDRWVAFLSIGVLGLNRLFGASPDLVATTTPANRGLTDDGRPWGGMLLPRLAFGNALEAAGVRYYRIAWRRGSSGAFLPLTGTVTHYYRHDVPTPTGDMPAWSPFVLGPVAVPDGSGHEVPDLFRIPFASLAPSGGVWDVPPDVNEIREHFASAKFPTATIAPGSAYASDGSFDAAQDTSGPYQLEVTLYDGQGQKVDLAALGIVFAVPHAADAEGVVTTSDAAALGLVSGNGLVVTLHVDNNPCHAAIAAPLLAGAPADPCCGVLRYASGTAPVTLAWTALHPHGFATYDFDTVRGVTHILVPNTATPDPGDVVDAAHASGPVAPGGSPIILPAATLMTANVPPGCPAGGCTVAGFAETLSVWALATDGWSRQAQHDRSAVRAFVLSAS